MQILPENKGYASSGWLLTDTEEIACLFVWVCVKVGKSVTTKQQLRQTGAQATEGHRRKYVFL